jgi:hypothetical protein
MSAMPRLAEQLDDALVLLLAEARRQARAARPAPPVQDTL